MIRALSSVLATIAILAGLPAAAQARTQMRSIFQDDCLIVQISADPLCNTADRGATLDTIKQLGADTIRVTVIRDKTETLGYGPFDTVINAILARGMAPLLSLTDRERTPTPTAYASFVRDTARHYPRVHLWSLYNEPNLLYWLPSRSPRDYRNIFAAAQSALRGVPGHGRDTVLMGELAPHVTANAGTATGPLRFTREVFCLDSRLKPYTGQAARKRGCTNFKRFTADGFAMHPYTKAALKAPDYRDHGDGYSISSLGSLTRIIDAAARVHRTNRMNLWDTEMGFQSAPPQPEGPSLAQQAEYINWADWIQYRNPRVASVDQFLLRDQPFVLNLSFNTALISYRGSRKPAYDAYRLGIFPTVDGRGFVKVWAQARPGGAQTVVFERQANGRGPFRRVAAKRTNSSGYVEPRFRGGSKDRWRVRWNGFTSRVAAVRSVR